MFNKIKNIKPPTIFFKISLIFIAIFSLFFVYEYKKNYLLEVVKKDNKTKTIIKPSITNIDTSFYQLKSSSQSKKMFFSFKIENINFQNKILYINLEGEKNSLSDAIDLQLEIGNNIEIKKIIEGDSFISYPRKIINPNNIIITGTALSEKGEFKLAQPRSNFIKINFLIKNPYQKSSIKLNQEKSKIFFAGKNITDLKNSFKEIVF